MSAIPVTINLPEELVEEAREFGVLSDELIAELVQAEVDRRKTDVEAETEAEWEARVMTEALGDALNEDGSIDFDKLDKLTVPITLEELFPEGVDDDEA